MSQKEFEKRLLAFLKKEGGLVLYEEITQWKMQHPEFSGCSIKDALKSLEAQGLVELTDRGAKAK